MYIIFNYIPSIFEESSTISIWPRTFICINTSVLLFALILSIGFLISCLEKSCISPICWSSDKVGPCLKIHCWSYFLSGSFSPSSCWEYCTKTSTTLACSCCIRLEASLIWVILWVSLFFLMTEKKYSVFSSPCLIQLALLLWIKKDSARYEVFFNFYPNSLSSCCRVLSVGLRWSWYCIL